MVIAGSQASALALDAADGRIDGRYFGAQVAVGAPAGVAGYGYGAPAGVAGYGYGAPAGVTGYGYGAPAGVAVAGSQSAALALDAADGRIDGRFYGAPVAAATPY
jgi:hypothetical protein